MWDDDEGTVFTLANKLLYRLEGSTWKPASTGLLDANGNLTATPQQFIGSGDWVVMMAETPLLTKKMFLSKNGGATWFDASGLLPNLSLMGLAKHGDKLLLLGNDVNDAPHLFSMNLGDLDFKEANGTVFEDKNADGQRDPGEDGLPFVKVKTLKTNFLSTTDEKGDFSIYFSANAQDSLAAIPPNAYGTVTTPPVPLSGNPPGGLLQGIHFQPNIRDLCVDATVLTAFRPGFENTIFITVKNAGTEPADGWLRLTLPPTLAFDNSNLLPTKVVGDTIFWDFTDLPMLQRLVFEVSVRLSPGADIGNLLEISASVGPLDDDAEPGNNVKSLREIVVGSYDPNDKKCDPARLAPQAVVEGERLTYTIRFQNTGNYPATFVRVLDTLDWAALEPSSVEILGASHPFTWSLRRQNVLEFFFENINLPDSLHDEPGSHGFVRFSILPKNSLKLGDEVQNRAFIYFDYNAPVETNTVRTEVANPVFTHAPRPADFDFEISPNPGIRNFYLKLEKPLPGAVRLTLHDASGRLVFETEKINPSKNWPLQLPDLEAGQYVLSLRWRGAMVSKKIVVRGF